MLRHVHSASRRARAGQRWPIILSALSALALGIFLWQNDLGDMWQALTKANPVLVLLALVLFVAHHAARAAR